MIHDAANHEGGDMQGPTSSTSTQGPSPSRQARLAAGDEALSIGAAGVNCDADHTVKRRRIEHAESSCTAREVAVIGGASHRDGGGPQEGHGSRVRKRISHKRASSSTGVTDRDSSGMSACWQALDLAQLPSHASIVEGSTHVHKRVRLAEPAAASSSRSGAARPREASAVASHSRTVDLDSEGAATSLRASHACSGLPAPALAPESSGVRHIGGHEARPGLCEPVPASHARGGESCRPADAREVKRRRIRGKQTQPSLSPRSGLRTASGPARPAVVDQPSTGSTGP